VNYFKVQAFCRNTENCEKTEKSILVHRFPLLFLVSAQTNHFMSDSQNYTAATVKKQRPANIRMSSSHLFLKEMTDSATLTTNTTIFLAAPQRNILRSPPPQKKK